MKAIVTIRRRDEIADPEGTTIRRTLIDLGYPDIESVRVNRTIELSLPTDDADDALRDVRGMCEKLLANPVMEDFDIELVE